MTTYWQDVDWALVWLQGPWWQLILEEVMSSGWEAKPTKWGPVPIGVLLQELWGFWLSASF